VYTLGGIWVKLVKDSLVYNDFATFMSLKKWPKRAVVFDAKSDGTD
jgi:hypothetical protein